MRAVYFFQGEELVSFFQGLLTQDVSDLKCPIYTCMLNAQGRFFCDFFIIPQNNGWCVEIDQERQHEILKKLSLYRLRANVCWSLLDVVVSTSATPLFNGYQDPRHPAMGYRAHTQTELEDLTYHQRRFTLGIPEKELTPNKSIPLEYNLDRLHAISWTKGCYIGQELTARTHYLGMIHKRIFPFQCNIYPTEIKTRAGEEAGKILSFEQGAGLAMIRLEYIDQHLFSGQNVITILNI